MIRKLRSMFIAVILFPAAASLAQAQTAVPSSSLLDPQSAPQLVSREDELYNAGTEALNNGDYDEAIGKFDQAAKLLGKKADAALYWKAYALAKTGNKGQAAATIAELKKSYPQSKWLKDASAIEIEMNGAAANPESFSSEEEKLLALNAIMQSSDADRALPYIDKMLHGNSSAKVKERALFVLSQSSSEKAQQTLLSIAKSGEPDLQKRAIRYIGMNGSPASRAALKEIYSSIINSEIKKAIFQGWLMCGCKEEVLKVAQTERAPGMRREAIRYLGMMGARAELRQLYQNADVDLESKEELLKAMGMGGDVEGLAQIAKTEKDPVVRRHAIKDLGIFGGHSASDALVSLYGSEDNVETKKTVINALFLNGAGKQMVFLARKETNPELRSALTQKMSLMSSPEITEYMLEILNK